MEYTVITYGAGEILSGTFNAIAALINSNSGALYQPLIRLALSIGLVWATALMVYGDQSKFLKAWVVPFYLALSLFFAPTCRIHIHDPVTGYRFSVDNVPWGLGATAGALSQLGHTMTQRIESTFSLPDDLQYHKTGSMMASNLIANARTFRITDQTLRETMGSFMNQCVVYDALMGQKYTLDDLQKSADIWGLISANASPARAFLFKSPGRGSNARILTCAHGVKALEPYLNQQVETAFQVFERKIFGAPLGGAPPGEGRFALPGGGGFAPPVSGQQLKQYLPGALNFMTNMAKSAQDHMMQQLMIHTTVDAIEQQSSELGNAPNFAVRRAYLQQRAHQETLAGVAAQKVIAMKNVLEALIYAAFLFILPLALVPMGWQVIGKWIGLVLWIQLWPPLYAILNFMMNVAARSKGMGLITDPAGSGITIANSVGFGDLHADMAAQAGFLSLAVGSLAYALIKGGAGGLSHMVSHMGSPAINAAASAAESRISGNYGFGNVSSGTFASNTWTSDQHMGSPSYNSGAFSQNDGVISRTTSADGSHIVSVATSNLRSSMNLSESLSHSYTDQAQKAIQMSESNLAAAANSEADHYRQVMDFAAGVGRSTSEGETFSKGETAGTNQTFSKLNHLVDQFSKDHALSEDTSRSLLGRAAVSLSGGFGFEVFGSGVSARGVVEASSQYQSSKSERDVWSEAQQFSKQHNLQEVLSAGSQAARNSHQSEGSDKTKRLSDSLSGSFEEAKNYREEASKHLQESETYSNLAATTRQNAAVLNANLNQDYVNWLSHESLPNSHSPMGIQEAETILRGRPDLDYAYQKRFMDHKISEMASFDGRGGLPTNESDVRASYHGTSVGHRPPYDSADRVAEAASAAGLDPLMQLGGKTQSAVTNQLARLQDQMTEQTEWMQKQEQIRIQTLKK